MPVKLLVTSFLFFTASANAAVFQEYFDLTAEKQEQLRPMQNATVKIKPKDGLLCTAVYVGKNGEALTALHCIEKCLEKAGVVSQELAFNFEAIPGGSITKNRVTLPSDKTIKCQMNVRHEADLVESVDVDILSVLGPGWLTPRVDGFYYFKRFDLPGFLATQKQGYESHGDLALIQLPKLPNTVCAKIAPTDFINGDPVSVVNLAYTSVLRSSGPGKPLKQIGNFARAIVSFGFGSNSRKLDPKASDTDFELSFPTGTVRLSTDGESGASGSPVFNEQGEVVAITRLIFAPLGNTQFINYSTQGVDLAQHREQLSKLSCD